jgi:hypothetical protein
MAIRYLDRERSTRTVAPKLAYKGSQRVRLDYSDPDKVAAFQARFKGYNTSWNRAETDMRMAPSVTPQTQPYNYPGTGTYGYSGGYSYPRTGGGGGGSSRKATPPRWLSDMITWRI